MTFEATRKQPTQEHFYIVEIDLPIITGTCELSAGVEGFGTPLSCPITDGTSATAIKTYRFATNNAPIIPVSPLYRYISGVNEQATELQPDSGLAFRGRATITFADFEGFDPNFERASGAAVSDNGTFFGKLKQRNVFEGREVRVIKYRKSANFDYTTDGQITYYVARELKRSSGGNWQLACVDELSRIEFDQSQIPPEQNSFLRLDVDDAVTSIPVDGVTDWSQRATPYVIRVGEEYLTVTSVVNNQTGLAALTVNTRGADIGAPQFTNTITKTITDTHSAGDSVFICIELDGVNIATALEEILLSVDIPSSIIPISDWLSEVAAWHPTDFVTGLYDEPMDSDLAILRILEPYLMQMWFDPIDREIKLKAISNWVASSSTVSEGKEIDYDSLSSTDVDSLRYSTAFITYDKPFLSGPDEASSFKKTSISTRPELETIELYGTKPKVKKFNRSTIINKDAADLLTSRYVQRFGVMPERYKWTTQERNLNFKVGDVVNLNSPNVQGFDGLPSNNTRAQVIKVQPFHTKFGREYKVTALTYQPAISSGAAFTIVSATELNLFVLAGAPSAPVDVTFIFDGGAFKSTDFTRPSVKAGAFAAGSKIDIILRGGADWQGKGGGGGRGAGLFASPVSQSPEPTSGGDAGIVYDAQGVDTDIYLSGADPLSGTADGALRAPSGGDGGFDAIISPTGLSFTGNGGRGGDGFDVGAGGLAGVMSGDTSNLEIGSNGPSGKTDGTGSGWASDGANNDASGGLKGKGIVKNGAIVKLFGDTPSNFINGGGDTPDV